jgi:hypothetical protein
MMALLESKGWVGGLYAYSSAGIAGGVDTRDCSVVMSPMLVTLLISVFHGEIAGDRK